MPLQSHQINTVAALLARSNMGMPIKDAEDMARRIAANTHTTLDSAVCGICEQYMESDEHYDMFLDEAKYFAKEIRKSEKKSRASWPDAFAIAGV